MSAPDQEREPRIAPGFARRLSYYLFGIAIGLLMLGLINQARQRAAASNNAAQTPQIDETETRPPDEQAP